MATQEFDDWEIVDVQSDPKQTSPKCSSTKINDPTQSQLSCNDDEKKNSMLHTEPALPTNDEECDLAEQYERQQKRLLEEEKKYRQLGQQLEQSILIANNNRTKENKIDKMEYKRIMEENQKTLSQLEAQKEESQNIIQQILRENEELKKKLEEACTQREHDKKQQRHKEKEFAKEVERSKELQHKREMERELIKKEKELVEKEKEILKKEKEGLLLLQQQKGKSRKNNSEEWKCLVCGTNNDESFRYCQSCSQMQHYDESTAELLTIKQTLNAPTWKPCEEQEYGWVLQNNSKMPLKMKVKLTRVGNNKDIAICEEESLVTYEVKAKDELHIIVNARAPALCGKYYTSWQMVTHDNRKVGPVLEMKLDVRSDLTAQQEAKVKQMLCNFGFKNRDDVVAILIATEWDLQLAAQELGDQMNRK